MSKEIDWSKAPEGATHWVGGNEPWHKHIGDTSWYWQENQQKWYQLLICASDVEDEYRETIVKKPEQSWTGQGLPPVGTVCEVNWCEGWHKCEIIAHFEQRCGMVAAFTVIGPLGSKSLDAYRAEEFRPIRTQEQIEAEEREAFALNLVTEMGKDPEIHSRSMVQARKIYDLGYRKQGGDK